MSSWSINATFCLLFCFYMCDFFIFPFPFVQSLNFLLDNIATEVNFTFSARNRINISLIYQFSLINFGLISFLANLLFCFPCVYVLFDRNLSTLNLKAKLKAKINYDFLYLWLSIPISILIMSENTSDINISTIIYLCTSTPLEHNFFMSTKRCKLLSPALSLSCYLCITASAVSPESHVLCILLTDLMCSTFLRNKPLWVPFLLILLANDVELNPGDHYHERFFNFMNWNLNSLAKNNFERG